MTTIGNSNRKARIRIAVGIAVAAAAIASPLAAEHATRTGAPALTAAKVSTPAATSSRDVCAESKGHAHCDAKVRTDSSGKPLVFRRPTNDPNAASGVWNSFGLSPASFHKAYNLPWYTNVRQTIAVVDAYDHPNVKNDLDVFDTQWGLGSFPSCSAAVTTACFQRVDENGYPSGFTNNSTTGATGWSQETNLDVQTAHGICLNCKLLLVEAYTDSRADLAAAVNTAARLGATEISNSYGWLEGSFSDWNPSAYNHAGIAITASAHDHGYGAYYPADLNTVVAVGGTYLQLASDGSRLNETVWGNGVNAPSGRGTGSGCSGFSSSYTSAAYWQKTVGNWSYTGCGNQRAVSDVSADADPNSGAWVYDSADNEFGQSGWFAIGGTSLSAPLIAGVYALAGNAASWTWPAQSLYQHPGNLIDVRSGSNGSCQYTIMCTGWSGYDGPTGLGTPWGLTAF